MKKTTKILAIILLAALALSVLMISSAATANSSGKITVNGQDAQWSLTPFTATFPLGNTALLMPMRDLFKSLGYTVIYDEKLHRSVFTANGDSTFGSFYVDVKTGQIVKSGGEIRRNGLNQTYLINNSLYITAHEFKTNFAESFLKDHSVTVDFTLNSRITHEHFIIQYNETFPVHGNLTSLTITVSGNSPDHPYIGEQFTKYNTGTWAAPPPILLEGSKEIWLWNKLDTLRFFTGAGEQNELTGSGGKKNSITGEGIKMYAVAWELMDGIATEINRLRKENGLSELTVDHSICFIKLSTGNPKINSVFDNAVHNFENDTFHHTLIGRSIIKAENTATVSPRSGDGGNTTQALASRVADGWYKSQGHKRNMMGANHTTVGVLVVIADTGTKRHAYAVFK